MKFVIDTNILVSFFRPNPVNDLITNANLFDVIFYSSEYNIKELKNKKRDILKYANIDERKFAEKLVKLRTLIKIIPDNEFKSFDFEAKKLSPHDKDIPIFALALRLNSAIWSNEPAFKQQSTIKVLSTRDMIELFL